MEINRKRVAKRLASGLMAGALALGGLAVSGSSPAGAVPIDIDEDQRIGGDDRYATSALVAETLEDELGADIETVIIASGENFPDALAASALAGDEAPILLVQSDAIPSVVRDRLNRLSDSVTDAIIVGGVNAISADVEAEIGEILDNADVVRISGDNRYATAVAIAEEVGIDAGTIALVSGENFADAVSVGPWAGTQGYPILLATSSGIPDETSAALEAALEEDETTRVVIVGGSAAVSASAESDLVELGFTSQNVSRVAGSDRYLTNLLWNTENLNNIGKQLNTADRLTLDGNTILFVSGSSFPDALSAAPLAAHLDAHLVLASPTGGVGVLSLGLVGSSAVTVDALSMQTAAYIDDATTATGYTLAALNGGTGDDYFGQSIWIVGGTSAVTETAMDAFVAAAHSEVSCTVTVAGGNDDATAGDGPKKVVVAFSRNLSAETASGDGEKAALNTAAEIQELVEINGDSLGTAPTLNGSGGTAFLDLNADGLSDAISILLAAGDDVTNGDTVSFVGWDEDTEDYATTGYGLSQFSSCEADVARDRTAPTLGVYAVVGSDQLLLEFSEPLSGALTEAAWLAHVEDLVDDSVAATTPGDTSCVSIVAYQTWACETAGGAVAANDDIVKDATDFYDEAGNLFVDSVAAYDDYGTAAGVVGNPELDSGSVTCIRHSNGSAKDTLWTALTDGTLPATTDADVNIDTDSGGVIRLRAGTQTPLLTGNDWTFTVEQERGLNVPVVSVDGTDVTITIDKYFHTANDVVFAINRSSVGVNVGAQNTYWTASLQGGAAAGDSIDDVMIGETVDSDSNGTVGNIHCLVAVTFDAPMLAAIIAAGAFPTADGEISVRVGGEYQTVTWDWSLDPTDPVGGFTAYGYFATTSTGTVRVDAFARYMDDTNAAADGETSLSVGSI